MRTSLLVGMLALVACGKDNPLREYAQGIVAATTTARSASLAMASIAGTALECAQVMTACATYPCQGAVNITVGGSCAYPLSAAATGTVTVSGQWTSRDDATLSAQFVDVRAAASEEAIALAQVTQISATRAGDTISVSYSGSNAGARSGLSGVAVGGANGWKVAIATAGTDDPADDSMTVEATAATASAGIGAQAKTVSFDGVRVEPSCALNPVAGTGSITEVSTFVPKITKISFHAACDGKGEVNGDSYEFDASP